MEINAKVCISLRACCFSLLLIILNMSAVAQVMNTGLRGLVRDTTGAVIPNASIKLSDNATGQEFTTVSSSSGTFLLTGLQASTYKLTITAPGFQTAINQSLAINAGRTTDISIDLAASGTTESVQVSASTDQLNTTTNEVISTIDNKIVKNLPYVSRDGLQFALLMAGNSTANDPNGRRSTFNGLPNASMNIMLDGMNNNSQRFKSGGTSFFSFAPARIDALEEVSVQTAGLGANASGQGAMTINLTTKRGTDQYHGKLLYQFQNEAMNANTYFNKLQGRPRNKSRQNYYVGSIGGPLVPFVSKLKDKLFFFAYYEAYPQPTSLNVSRTVITPDAQLGNFSFIGTDGNTHTVNLLNAAGGTIDPTIKGVLNEINATKSNGQLIPNAGTPSFQTLTWQQSRDSMTAFPTVRLDYQINQKMAWHGTWNLRHQNNPGYPLYPGSKYDSPNGYKITTYVATNTFDWTINPNLTNSATVGIQSNGEIFNSGASPQQYSVQGNRILNFPIFNDDTSVRNIIPNSDNQPFIRNNPVYQFTDNVQWVKGRHTMTLGGTFLHTSFYETYYDSAGVPQFSLGVDEADPANQLLNKALKAQNINEGNDDIPNALDLYALLTGRVTKIEHSINVNENTKQYAPYAPVTTRIAFSTLGLYAQDSFRFRPNLTINYGLRWQFDGAIHSTNGINYTASGNNFYGPSKGNFQPGVYSSNNNPVFTPTSNPYKGDFLNPAPNFGFSWNPEYKDGFLSKIFGDRKTVIRGSYSIAFFNEGLNTISNPLQNGPGASQRGATVWTDGKMNLTTSSSTPPLFPAKFGEPISQSSLALQETDGFNINSNLRSPYTQTWTLGIQRELDKNTVLEIRYIGNKSTHLWHQQNMQETNIFENGFLTQFNQARKNLAINQAKGNGNTFENKYEAGQGPIPIFEAAFNGLSAGEGFQSSTFLTNLRQGTVGALATTLATTPTYYCRMVGANFAPCAGKDGATEAGAYPINFFQPNPNLRDLRYQDSNGNGNYNALQLDLKRRYSQGLLLGANYTWSHALGDIHNESDQEAFYQWFTTRNSKLNYMATPFDRRHVFNVFFVYDLPFGKGKLFSVNNGILDRVIGGWSIGSRTTIASGNPLLLDGQRKTVNNLTQSGVVFGNDFTPEQLQKALSKVSGYFAANKVMISNVANIATVTTSSSKVKSDLYAPASTPGQYGQFVQLRNSNFYQLDLNLTKEIRFTERWKLSLRADAFNFLNRPFFDIGNSNPNSNSFGQVTKARGERTMQIRAAIEW